MLSHASGTAAQISEEDRLRAQLYSLLGALLAREPDKALINIVKNLKGDETPLGVAFTRLSNSTADMSFEALKQEFSDLFIGMGRGELVPYGSYYLTGFLNEKPLAKLRNTMREFNIERAENVKEPEDNIGFLMEMMAGLIEGHFGEFVDYDGQRSFFNQHIAPWASHFFKDLEKAESSKFYKPVGEIGVLFMEIEQTAFQME